MSNPDYLSFRLPDDFIEEYANRRPEWGFPVGGDNYLSELTYVNKYSALKDDGTKEQWFETVRRCIEGMYSILKDHCKKNKTPWYDIQAQKSARNAYDRMWHFKWMPPGRGVQHMGRPSVHLRQDSSFLQNCAFLTTAKLSSHSAWEATGPFVRMMEMSMCGIGVGFDTRGAGNLTLHTPQDDKSNPYVVKDSREGWAEAMGVLLESYFFKNRTAVEFDYSEIRPSGALLKSFGGRASGPQPLIDCVEVVQSLLDDRDGEKITSTDIVNIMNLIGKAVVAGGARRSAQIAFGSVDDHAYTSLKDWNLPENKERCDPDNGWAWNSNNSVFVEGEIDPELIEKTVMNGEPGYMWLDLAQQYGRMVDPPNNADYRAMGGNPCLEQTLEPWECCVSGDTLIHTYNGLVRIGDVIGKDVLIWNGENWASVSPFYTGNQPLYRVTLSDGSRLDTTPGHEWLARKKTARKYRTLKTTDLEVGMVLPEFELSDVKGRFIEHAYEWGWFAGDGYMDNTKCMALVQQPEYVVLESLKGVVYPEQENSSGTKFKRVNISEVLPLHIGVELRDHSAGLPDAVLSMDSESLSNFFGGWIDSDGSLISQNNTDHYVLYGDEQKLRQAQMLLRRIGVNHSHIAEFAAKGTVTNYGPRNQALWRLLIPSYEAETVVTKLKVASNFGGRYAVNNAHVGSVIDRARKQKIVSIEKISDGEDTYCFNESLLHQGVFGNVLTKQCTLVETFPTKHVDFADYRETLKAAYLYGKAVTLLPTAWPETNEVMARNRRIGCSMSGLAEFVETRSWSQLQQWMDEGYQFITHRDQKYSEWLAVRESIKKTSIKPSGTVSLVASVTPGVHWPVSAGSHIRRVRYSIHDPLVERLIEAGYPCEPMKGDPKNTVVVTFVTESAPVRDELNVSIWEKAELAVMAQRWWADNQVSSTVSFVPSEEDQIAPLLASKKGQIKGISFLPKRDHTVYAQAPYEQISPEDAAKFMKKVKPLGDLYAAGTEAVGDKFCDSDVCTI